MIALILAAGYATRLYPLTKDTPKPLLPVQGSRTILDLLIGRLEVLEDITEILIVTNDRFFHAFGQWHQQYQGEKPIRILNDGTSSPEGRLGAIGDIQYVLERERLQDDLLVLAGDNVLGFGLEGYLNYFHKIDRDCILVRNVDNIEELRSVGVAELDAEMRVLSLEEKPQEPRSSIGVFALYIYKRTTLPLISRYLAEGGNPDAPSYFPEWLHSRQEMRAYYTEGTIDDVGTPEAYAEMRARLGAGEDEASC
ncbi:NTP transferase domain-containing protein [Paenibacillus sp. LMG 31459]|uniref:NTP transferase domain-containing protein n=1 Tax=Paenibacillus phytohabitans TaxID=2654978 RepID=A0ABX1YPC3_9BACL|nr:sugar phosphate nucleotidyltransferase [Paenibacillus phytohabitans]NOU81781.1 NTP transferase domain-containing protein [Paenibacillus phytohabitans]